MLKKVNRLDITKTFVYFCTKQFVNMQEASKPTSSELEILNVLWKHGDSSVRFVNNELNKVKKVGYTTTLKLMQIMTEKGFLLRNTEQKVHIYRPIIQKSDTQMKMVDSLLNSLFGGSAQKLVMQVLGNHSSSQEELEEIKKLIKKLEEK